MDNTNNTNNTDKSTDTNKATDTNTITYGNLEITVEGITDEQLDKLLDTIIEKVESFGLEMVARTYKTTDADDEDEGVEDAKEPPTTQEG